MPSRVPVTTQLLIMLFSNKIFLPILKVETALVVGENADAVFEPVNLKPLILVVVVLALLVANPAELFVNVKFRIV